MAKTDFEMLQQLGGPGLHIHPSIKLSRDLETKHIVYAGAPGSGKTTILSLLIREAIDRGDRCIVFDPKPDFSEWLPGDPVPLAPWDRRAKAWDIAADVTDTGHAQSLAAMLIPEGREPVFSQGARQILQAAIMECQERKPLKWELTDLVLILAESNELQKIVSAHLPFAYQLVADLESKTTQSFLTTISAHLGDIQMLASWWHGKEKLSIRRWLQEEGSEKESRILILGGNDEYHAASACYIKSFLAIAACIICGPSIPDSRDRTIWLFLDEAPKIGKMDEISQLLAVGRSKGVRVVIGVQDISQLRELYSVHTAQAWASMFGTWIITQVKGTESPKWFSELLGERSLWRYTRTTQREKNGSTSGTSEHWQKIKEPVMNSHEFTDLIGPTPDGIRAILYIPGLSNIYILKWPYNIQQKVRELYIEQPIKSFSSILNLKKNTEIDKSEIVDDIIKVTNNKYKIDNCDTKDNINATEAFIKILKDASSTED